MKHTNDYAWNCDLYMSFALLSVLSVTKVKWLSLQKASCWSICRAHFYWYSYHGENNLASDDAACISYHSALNAVFQKENESK